MSEDAKVFQVLISSPGDVDAERVEVEQALKELNENAFGSLGIRLEPIKWESNCYPSVGTDSQAVVSEQLGDNYSIFIGIFWKNSGTPTPRASSGTIDEFERAYARWLKTRSPQIMFYFKNGLVPLREVNPDQLTLINEFRERLKQMGVLFWDYNDQEHFAKLIRMQIPMALYRWQNDQRQESGSATVNSDIFPTTKSSIDENNEGVEEGFLDLIEAGEETFEDLLEILGRINESITVLGEKVETRSNEYNDKNKDRKNLKQFGDRVAGDLDNFANRMNVDVPQFAKLFSNGIDKYTRAFTISTDFNDISEPYLSDGIKRAIEMRTSIKTAREPVINLRNIITATPRLTTAFVQARRHAITALDVFINEMATAIDLTSEMKKVIEETTQTVQNRKGR